MLANPEYGGETNPEHGTQTEVNTQKEIGIEAFKNEGWFFICWKVEGPAKVLNPYQASTKVILYDNATVTAVFSETKPQTARVTFDVSPANGGQTNPSEGLDVNLIDGKAQFEISAIANEGYLFYKWTADPSDNNTVFEGEYFKETVVTVSKDVKITAMFIVDRGEEDKIKSAQITSSHSESVKKSRSGGGGFQQNSKDKYSITLKFDLSKMGEDYAKISPETAVAFSLGSLFNISDLGQISKLGDINSDSKKYKGQKGGSMSKTIKASGKSIAKISFKWSKSEKKELIVTIVGTPLENVRTNILDLSDNDEFPQGSIAGELKGVRLVFGNMLIKADDYSIGYSGEKKIKSVDKRGTKFDLMSWSVKGKK